ncbi:SDR family NAD(P)-dependent oxidoreductase [Spiroplasma endosymbiont of Amphibalanus improvisus]|uniref:SDR family NAD(P)-dependent oxidoreductase n=1 Tax=Spiroplasma endosymbiont of Amphibalanus improvisus TaxID=3066327 RepID=UPI00313AB164
MNSGDTREKWALVTGASKGLGFCYAQQLLNLNYNIITVARSSGYAANFKVPEGLKTITYNMDLSVYENNIKLFERIKNVDINVFVNNAGFGLYGKFVDIDLNKEINLIDLNVKSVHILTKLMVQKMSKQPNQSNRIINLTSVVAHSPTPLLATYAASKGYVLSLSQAVNFELKKNKIKTRVISISPGPLQTSFNNRAKGISEGTIDDPIPLSTMKFAEKSIKKAIRTKHKDEIVCRTKDKWIIHIGKLQTKKQALKITYKFIFKAYSKDNQKIKKSK